MQLETINRYKHNHNFSVGTPSSEKKVGLVFILTTLTMIIEIVAGNWYGSMALLADGWHMFTHSGAFAIAMFAYWFARKHENNTDFSFGTGKVTSLSGFASAVALSFVALIMAIESIERFFTAQTISFEGALVVAIVGLFVNVTSAFLLHDKHEHHHDTGNSHHHHDHNLKAAYFHVLADTLTSLFAIVALMAGKYLGWLWMDSLMGIIGAFVITKWAYSLLRESSRILLDKCANKEMATKLKNLIEDDSNCNVVDLHIWRLSTKHIAGIISIVTKENHGPDYYMDFLKTSFDLSHLTIEVRIQ